ncbi:hypothetical protein QBC34DRAFT_98798 [Podospora aff. communis PSN243]|uniref:Uncharacterized protein n=1 Tax=Podospora aff. communis PSN243 TaxID=3040156 RepID=A0AAV9GP54_9PEZI|nr:hypothetical protein QBC34DRAFT_98798 [Podospora aff. communis PSN243]
MAGSIFTVAAFMAHLTNASPLPRETSIERRAPGENSPSAIQIIAIVVSSVLVASVMFNFYLLHSRSRAHRDRVEFRNMALYYKTALQATLDAARNGTLDLTQREPWLHRADRPASFYAPGPAPAPAPAPRLPQISANQAAMSAHPHSLSTIAERTERSVSPYSTEAVVAGPSCERPVIAGPSSERRMEGNGPLNSNPIELQELRRPRQLSRERSPAPAAATADLKGKGKEIEMIDRDVSPR